MGYLVPLDEDIPFEVKRLFYLIDVPKEVSRGRHAYRETKQVLICVSGEVKVKCQEAERDVIYQLYDNKQALYLEPHVWREAYDFSEGAVLLVLSSKEYSEEDYRR
ncbi:MAG: sugar 3,4-ketoisomerase [Turicibacter sp.]